MSERLLIRLQANGQMTWLVQDAAGHALSGTNVGVPATQVVARAQRIVVLVPAEDVTLVETPRIAGGAAQLRRAVPFALEDQLAGAVEDLHFAISEHSGEDAITVAVVARATLIGWIDQLANEGIRADALFSEAQALPIELAEHKTRAVANDIAAYLGATVLIESVRALWRLGSAQAGVCELSTLPDWLLAIASVDEKSREFSVYDFRDAAPLDLPIKPVRYDCNQRDALAFFAAHLDSQPKLNLLQGEFAPIHRQAPAKRLWRNAATLTAAAIILVFVYNCVDCWRLSRQSARLDVAAQTILHDTFPRLDKVPGDPRQLMQSAMRGLSATASHDGLLPLLGRIAPIIGSTTRNSLTGMEFHNDTLELAMRAPDIPTLDDMRGSLGTLSGLNVELTAVNSGAGGVDGRLRISRSKP